jgi:hypothetical protein
MSIFPVVRVLFVGHLSQSVLWITASAGLVGGAVIV